MRLRVAMAFTVVMAAAALGWAAAPRLVRSEPANGARNVAVDVGSLKLVFDQDMRQNQWTLMRSGRGELPPTDPNSGALWVDGRTFELRLGRLKPGATYAVQLNSDRRQGFRSASDDTPLPVTVVVFATDGGPAPASPPAAAPGAAVDAGGAPPVAAKAFSAADLAGDWRHRSEAMEIALKLLAGGRYESSTALAGATHPDKGTWRVEEGALVRQPDAGGEPMRQKIESLSKDSLELSQGLLPRLKFTRAAAAGKGVLGSWLCLADASEIRATFGADGRCSYVVKSVDGGEESAKGSFRFADGSLVIRPEGQEESITFQAKLVDENTLDLTDQDGNTARLVRQGAAVASPAPKAKPQDEAQPQTQAAARQVLGTWVLRTEDGELRATFGADGRCSYVQKTAEEEERHEATWRLENGVLIIQPKDGDAERFRLRFPSQDTMEMVGDGGDTVTMTRQGK